MDGGIRSRSCWANQFLQNELAEHSQRAEYRELFVVLRRSRAADNPALHQHEVTGRVGRQAHSLASPDLQQVRRMLAEEIDGASPIPDGWKVCALGPLTSQGFRRRRRFGAHFVHGGKEYAPPAQSALELGDSAAG